MIELNHNLSFRLLVTLAGILLGSSYTYAHPIYTASPDSYRARLKALEPGAHLRLMPGEYKDGLPIHNLHGTAAAPITISGPDSGPRAIFAGRPGHNTVSIVNSSHVTIRNLDLDGRQLAVDGVKCEGSADWAHHITLDGLRVRGHGNDQQTVGISTKCPAWGWVIRNNVIAGAGTGLYLGDSDGQAPFIAGLIEHNLVVDTLGYNLQIKHQQPRPILPEIPEGRSVTIIRHNVFSKANGGSKASPRPNVLVGHWPLSGPGSDDMYLVYDNFFYQNPHESLFQGEGNIALYNNLFVNHFGDGARIQPHHGTTRTISVFYNTVITKGSGMTIVRRWGDPVNQQLISGNIIFALSPLRGTSTESNLTGGFSEARNHLVRPFAPLGEMNLAPKGIKVRKHAGNSARFAIYPDAGMDFDGEGLIGADRIGAYSLDKERPRWRPALEIKPINRP
ncbi:hypothetical protein SAMN05216386_1855 [Nitrosospira briensis]|uniref:Right handed beta helix region n=1 Tax=Nitrosospira briensis TaxID=35799 RepID=A0A1I5BX15_9PROT|nr:hypothetical protein [Nitrosospira briensis]SFN79224.1 hypothetical protein SAMN05216386_1855 [Nitrosospira briensis]